MTSEDFENWWHPGAAIELPKPAGDMQPEDWARMGWQAALHRVEAEKEPESASISGLMIGGPSSHDQLFFVGYTNGAQILYANESQYGEGIFYKDTNHDCVIPLYMLKTHWHRLESTTDGEVTLARIRGLRRPAPPEHKPE